MFSVIIPLYNKENCIHDTIMSVLNQTYPHFEIVVVNDGSNDNSLKVVESIQDHRVRIISKSNGGVSSARNRGIDEAEFSWLCFLDADDSWHEDYLKEVNNAVKNYNECQIFAVCQKITYLNKRVRYENEFLPAKGHAGLINYYQIISKYNPPLHSSSVIINKSIFNKSGCFRNGQRNYEDHDLWVRVSLYSKIIYINKVLCYHIKDDPNSASKQVFQAKDFLNYISTLKKVEGKISSSDRNYFLTYVNRFIPFTLIKYYKHYTNDEVKLLVNLSSMILNKTNTVLLKIITLLKMRYLYDFAKRIRIN